jgi:hypothetical protein
MNVIYIYLLTAVKPIITKKITILELYGSLKQRTMKKENKA